MPLLQRRWLSEVVYTVSGCIVILLMLWGYDQWNDYVARHKPSVPSLPAVQVGSQFALEGVDFRSSPVNLVIISSPVCKYCQASEHFHTKILEIASQAKVPVYMTVPSPKAAAAYLKSISIRPEAVRAYSQMSATVAGTPTVLGIDGGGNVKAIWSGLASPADENEIVGSIRSKSLDSGPQRTRLGVPNLEVKDLPSVTRKTSYVLLDVRERNSVSSATTVSSESPAMNIPSLELPFRAVQELDKSKLTIVDCRNTLWDECSHAVETLKKLRFNLATLGAGTYHLRCRLSVIPS